MSPRDSDCLPITQSPKLHEFPSHDADRILAMPEMTRTWVIPASTTHPELKLEIREPPMTGDNLGLKTWGTAFAISKKLEELGKKYFSHLVHGAEDYFITETSSEITMPHMRVLEYVPFRRCLVIDQ